MRNFFTTLLLPLFATAVSFAVDALPTSVSVRDTSPRQIIAWDTGWLFSKSDSAMAMAPALADASWRAVRVPHDWSMEEPFSADYGSGNGYAAGGVGWYR